MAWRISSRSCSGSSLGNEYRPSLYLWYRRLFSQAKSLMLDDIDVVASETPSNSYPSYPSSPGSSASIVSPGDIGCATCIGDVTGGLVFGGGGDDVEAVVAVAAAAEVEVVVRWVDEGSSPAIMEATRGNEV